MRLGLQRCKCKDESQVSSATCSGEKCPCPQQGTGMRWSLGPLLTQTILWFCVAACAVFNRSSSYWVEKNVSLDWEIVCLKVHDSIWVLLRTSYFLCIYFKTSLMREDCLFEYLNCNFKFVSFEGTNWMPILKGGSIRPCEVSWAEIVLTWFLCFKNETLVLSVVINS